MDGNTPVWKVWGDEESPIATIKAIRQEFCFSLNVCKLLFEDNRPTTGDKLVRAIRFGRVYVPTEEEARAELQRRKNKRAAEKRKATIERKKREADKVVRLHETKPDK